MKIMSNDPDMLEEYDFSKGVRGKYAKKYKKGTNVVFIDQEVAEFFPDKNSVNNALRSLIPIRRKRNYFYFITYRQRNLSYFVLVIDSSLGTKKPGKCNFLQNIA